MNKLISVIIPVKNGEKYLTEAIRGLQSQNMNLEIIVVDDGSVDKTAQIATDMGCVVLKHEVSKGQIAGKNTGLKNAHGEYVMFHDGDDVMYDGVLSQLYEALDQDESAAAVMGKVKDFLSPDCPNANSQDVKPEPYYGLFTGAVLMRRKVFDEIGLFNEVGFTGEIIDWKNKMDAHQLPIKKVDIVTTKRRIHDTNFGKTNRSTEFVDYAKILRAKLKRPN